MINGRSMPDDMDTNYAAQYPHQPYNGNPHMHPGELTLLRIVGQGRWQHPFHEHGNHVRILARDGNLIVSSTSATQLAGPLLFTTTTTPGQAMDGIFYWTGKGLNWDPYGHHPGSADPLATLTCTPDANGYNTGTLTAVNYYEWCRITISPSRRLRSGMWRRRSSDLARCDLFTNGAWYGGSPYLGPECDAARHGSDRKHASFGDDREFPDREAGVRLMWHSHNERRSPLTTYSPAAC